MRLSRTHPTRRERARAHHEGAVRTGRDELLDALSAASCRGDLPAVRALEAALQARAVVPVVLLK
jgi:hypothetical protein